MGLFSFVKTGFFYSRYSFAKNEYCSRLYVYFYSSNINLQEDMRKNILLLLAGVLILGSCKDKSLSSEEQLQKDIKEIQEYVTSNNLDAKQKESGLFYVISKEGNGNYPTANDDVTVRYKGYTTDGSVFDESDQEGITFNLKEVIKGWTEGIQEFKEGGKGMLLIPSQLAYGEKGSGTIQPNTVLIFDIELLTIVE